MSEIKPCPFCGGEAISGGITMKFMGKDQPKTYGVMCDNESCPVQPYVLEGRETESQAIAAWNTRSGGWQPIETAPKTDDDGEPAIFLTCGFHSMGCYMLVACHRTTDGVIIDTACGEPVNATHWMLLPAPPEVLK